MKSVTCLCYEIQFTQQVLRGTIVWNPDKNAAKKRKQKYSLYKTSIVMLMDYQFFNCELTCNLLNKCLLSFYQTVISVSDFGHTCVTCIFNKYFEEEKGKK